MTLLPWSAAAQAVLSLRLGVAQGSQAGATMKRLLLLASFAALSGCQQNHQCLSIEVGSPSGHLPQGTPHREELPGLYAGDTSRYQDGPPADSHYPDFIHGPGLEHYCCWACATGRTSACELAACKQVQCTSPELTGTEVKMLGSPYTYEYGFDDWQQCNIAVQGGVIRAVWSKHNG